MIPILDGGGNLQTIPRERERERESLVLLVSIDKIISLPKAKQTGAERAMATDKSNQSVFSIKSSQ